MSLVQPTVQVPSQRLEALLVVRSVKKNLFQTNMTGLLRQSQLVKDVELLVVLNGRFRGAGSASEGLLLLDVVGELAERLSKD